MSETLKAENSTDWHVELLRLTLFRTPSSSIGEPAWWSDLTGAKPEERTLRPNKDELIEEGVFDKGKLTLQANSFRVDWLFSKELMLDGNEELEYPTLGIFSDVLDKFQKLMLTWLSSKTAPATYRIAFGAVVHRSVSDHVDGYKVLAKYLHHMKISPESRDFFYQINRPRKSKSIHFKDLELNRLSKWACSVLKRRALPVVAAAAAHTIGKELYSTRLELDLSTPAESLTELSREHVGELYSELIALGKEISVKGDVP
jgi:hypothetical protein